MAKPAPASAATANQAQPATLPESERANPLKGRMQLGKVLFPEAGSRPWVDVCVREMIVFPNGKHDDQVDALAWAVRMTLERPPPKDPTPKPKGPESWKKKLQRMLSGQGGGHMAA